MDRKQHKLHCNEQSNSCDTIRFANKKSTYKDRCNKPFTRDEKTNLCNQPPASSWQANFHRATKFWRNDRKSHCNNGCLSLRLTAVHARPHRAPSLPRGSKSLATRCSPGKFHFSVCTRAGKKHRKSTSRTKSRAAGPACPSPIATSPNRCFLSALLPKDPENLL